MRYNIDYNGRINGVGDESWFNSKFNGDEPFDLLTAFDYRKDFDTNTWIYDPIIMVPQEITKLQCVEQLRIIDNNIYEFLLAKLDEDSTGWDRIRWDAAHILDRNSNMVLRMGEAIGMTSEDIDTFFIEAAKLEV